MRTVVIEVELHFGAVGVSDGGDACVVVLDVQAHHHLTHEVDLHQEVVSSHASGRVDSERDVSGQSAL